MSQTHSTDSSSDQPVDELRHILGYCECDRLDMNCWMQRSNDPDFLHTLPMRQYEAITAHIQAECNRAREIFVPVKGFEGLYEVSNTGKVRSLKGGRRSGKELAQASRGPTLAYKVVSLCKDGKSVGANVHRLVAQAFISNPENKRTVNHKDGNPSNNDVSNLEWATYSEQERHAYDVLGKVNSNSKLTPKQIGEIKQRLANGESNVSIATIYGVSAPVISDIKRGKIWVRAELQQIMKGRE